MRVRVVGVPVGAPVRVTVRRGTAVRVPVLEREDPHYVNQQTQYRDDEKSFVFHLRTGTNFITVLKKERRNDSPRGVLSHVPRPPI